VLPIVLSAAATPWLLERVRAVRGGLPGTVPSPEESSEAPRHPEVPTASEIDAAATSAINAARLQQRNMQGAVMFAPRQSRATPDGERVAPFQGFGLSIETTPAGARVSVTGADVGETPIVTTVDCEPGEVVEVLVEKTGYRAVQRRVRCHADELLELSIALVRPRNAR